jgi:hypothetical protein
MTKTFRIAVAIILGLGASTLWADASDSAGTGAAVFLRDGQGARALGMGGAYTAVGQGISSIFWNPGGLAFGRGMAVTLNENTLIDHGSAQSAAFVMPFGKGGRKAVAVQGLMTNMGEVEKRDASGNFLGNASLRGSAYAMSFGMRGRRLGAGLTVKTVEEDLAVEKGKATAADGGVLWARRNLALGAAFQNVGTKYKVGSKSYALASTFRGGVAYNPQNTNVPYLDRLTAALDLQKTKDQDFQAMAGFDFVLNRMLSLRTGYAYSKDTEALSGLSFGLGVWTDFQKIDFTEDDDKTHKRDTDSRMTLEIDYAYLMRDVFSDLHRLSLTLHF